MNKTMKVLWVLTILGFGFISAYNAADIDPQDSVSAVNKLTTDDQERPLLKFRLAEGNDTCLLAEFSGEITGQFAPNVTSTIILNGTLGDGSHCGEAMETLSVDLNDGNTLDFIFGKTDSSINLTTIKFNLNANTSMRYESNHTKTLYTVPAGNSFKCDSGISVDLMEPNDLSSSITLTLKSMRFDAFRKTQIDDYETNSICSADAKSNKVVPMIIAFVLGGMVVIMLVGYIILRRRENKSVYQSV